MRDEFGKPLTRSFVSREIWDLVHKDKEEFKQRVKRHFSIGYPGWTIVKADLKRRIIWIRDDRELHKE